MPLYNPLDSTAIIDGSVVAADLGVGIPLPVDHGFSSWTFDPALAVNTQILSVAGTLYLALVPVRAVATVTNLHVYVTTAGATLTSGQCFAGLFSTAGVLLSGTATQHTAWQSTGLKTMALTTPQPVAAGTNVYVGFYANGSTLPTLARSAGSAVANANLAGSVSRFGTADTGLTTALPAPMTTVSALATAWWSALS